MVAMAYFFYHICLNKPEGKRFENEAKKRMCVAKGFHYVTTMLSIERVSKYFYPDRIFDRRRLEIEGSGVLLQSFPQTIIYLSIVARSAGNPEVYTSLAVSIIRLLYFIVRVIISFCCPQCMHGETRGADEMADKQIDRAEGAAELGFQQC